MVDKNNGVIDKNTIKFADVWGKKQVSNPNFRDGIYSYKPTPRDIELFSKQINDYAELFMEQGYELTEMNSPLREMSM